MIIVYWHVMIETHLILGHLHCNLVMSMNIISQNNHKHHEYFYFSTSKNHLWSRILRRFCIFNNIFSVNESCNDVSQVEDDVKSSAGSCKISTDLELKVTSRSAGYNPRTDNVSSTLTFCKVERF